MIKLLATLPLTLALCFALSLSPAHALDLGGLAKKATGAAADGAREKAVKEVNAKLLAEGSARYGNAMSSEPMPVPK